MSRALLILGEQTMPSRHRRLGRELELPTCDSCNEKINRLSAFNLNRYAVSLFNLLYDILDYIIFAFILGENHELQVIDKKHDLWKIFLSPANWFDYRQLI